jgi:hypothetical protein
MPVVNGMSKTIVASSAVGETWKLSDEGNQEATTQQDHLR